MVDAKRRSTPEERHEMARQDMSNIRADPGAQHNLPLQLRGSAPRESAAPESIRARGSEPPEVIDDTPTPSGQGGIGSDTVADQTLPDDTPVAHAKGGAVKKPKWRRW